MATVADSLIESPQIRIFESIICYRHYEHVDPSKLRLQRDQLGPGALGGVAETWCKNNEVQGSLAMLEGYQQFLDGIPAILLGVPFGLAADRFGRKPVLILGMFSLMLRDAWTQLVTWRWQEFDVRMSWLSTFHGVMEGRNRANAFMRAGAADLLPSLFIPPVAARLMDWNPWIPCLLGTLARFISILLMIFVPETLDFKINKLDQRLLHHEPEIRPQRTSSIRAPLLNISNVATNSALFIKHGTALLIANFRLVILVVVFFGHSLLNSAHSIILQYCSRRYRLTLSTATMLLTIFNAVKVALLLLVIPRLSIAVKTIFRLSEQGKDLYTCRAAFALVFLGWSLIGLSPNVPLLSTSLAVAAAGTAPAYLLLRSFITSLVAEEHIARIYSAISMFDTLGSMFGAALVAGLFEKGMSLRGVWIGISFIFLGLVGGFSTIVMLLVQPNYSEAEEE
ncbi:MFS general substrate transporter [Whalleya microplaca]|nr:MFS general substrate transporter [Whalleya microplaca]